jgi:hypothetical protein
MSVRTLPPIYAHLGERELPVRWPWYRPEPQVGDTVRLPTAPDGDHDWRSFRVIGKRIGPAESPIDMAGVSETALLGMIHLDVEPLAPPA